MNKRGLSGIVTVILIILLVLVAIGIIWAAIRPPIQETGDRLSGDCLTLNVEALACKNLPLGGQKEVTFVRNPGAGKLTDIKFVFSNSSSGQTSVLNYGNTLTELQSDTKAVAVAAGFDKFNIAAVIQPGETPITCEITNQPVTCTP